MKAMRYRLQKKSKQLDQQSLQNIFNLLKHQ